MVKTVGKYDLYGTLGNHIEYDHIITCFIYSYCIIFYSHIINICLNYDDFVILMYYIIFTK